MRKQKQQALRKIYLCINIIIILVVMDNTFAYGAEAYDYVIENNKEIPIPVIYDLHSIYDDFDSFGTLNNPQDIFIASDQSIYIADTGNNRILKLNSRYKALEEFTGEDAGGLSSPEGVFVDKDGNIYIADTGNMRVLLLSSTGAVIREFLKPESDIIGSDFSFTPKKVSVGSTGMIYILCKTEAQGLITIDENGSFRGYVGTQKVGFNLKDFFLRIFGTAQQKKLIAKRLPTAVSNFIIKDDAIYAVLGNAKANQISIYNSIDKNLYPSGNYGGGGFLSDITVGNSGIVTVLDSENCKIYQYDKYGENIGIFGNKGNRKEEFLQPVGIELSTEGNLLVLDAAKERIQVFAPTDFMERVQLALDYYSNGEYSKASQIWEEVIKIDESYTLANKGIAQALYKQGDWKRAAERFEYITDRNGYSKAYSEYIHDIYRKYFGYIVLGICVLVILLYKMIKKLKKYAERL